MFSKNLGLAVAHPLWERGVAGSSPAAPTSKIPTKTQPKAGSLNLTNIYECLQQLTHNQLVGGSSPSRPTTSA